MKALASARNGFTPAMMAIARLVADGSLEVAALPDSAVCAGVIVRPAARMARAETSAAVGYFDMA